MGLIDDLGTGPIGLDTAVFLDFVEEVVHESSELARRQGPHRGP